MTPTVQSWWSVVLCTRAQALRHVMSLCTRAWTPCSEFTTCSFQHPDVAPVCKCDLPTPLTPAWNLDVSTVRMRACPRLRPRGFYLRCA